MWTKTILNGLYFSGIQAAFSPLCQGIGSVFMMHHIRDLDCEEFCPNFHLSISAQFLNVVILRLKLEGYEFVSLDEASRRIQNPELCEGKKPFLVLTLDDGYRNNLLNAVPVFRRHEVPYAIYVAPGMVDGEHTIWWEDLEEIIAARKKLTVPLNGEQVVFDTSTLEAKHATFTELGQKLTNELDEDEQRNWMNNLCKQYSWDSKGHLKNQVMNWDEITALSKDPLCTFGAHSMSHFALARLTAERSEEEMAQSRDYLKEKLGKPVDHFAFPYGYESAASPREFEIASNLGFETAVTTRHGVIYPEHKDHMTALPRISLNGSYQAMRYVRTLISGVPTISKNIGRKLNVS